MTDQMTPPVTVGDELLLHVREVAAGGWCVARVDVDADPHDADADRAAVAGFVVFVRHALPGERVRAVITQVTAKFARADAVEILAGAAERVRPPCPYAGPGACGGCDWQHASLPAQRELKARVISFQLSRIAGLDRAVTVEPLPGTPDGLGWRTRVTFAVGDDGRAGLRKHRSNEIVPVGDCLIAHPMVTQAEVTRQSWPGATAVEVDVAPSTGQRAVLVRKRGHHGPPPRRFLTQHAAGRDWRVSATGFWQVHPGAADTLTDAVLAGLQPEPGQVALDLFCGAGLFAGVLAAAVGPDGAVIGIENDAVAVADARHNLRDTPWARVHQGDTVEVLGRVGGGGANVAVLDPPRAGAGRALIEALGREAELRRVAYVSCDPATLARDLGTFARQGWRLDDLRAFDAFPMTHHVECLAMLMPPG